MDKMIKRKKAIDSAKERARQLGAQYEYSLPLSAVLTRSGDVDEFLVAETGMTKHEIQNHNTKLTEESRDIVWSVVEGILPKESEDYLKVRTAKTVVLRHIVIGGTPFTSRSSEKGSFNRTADETTVNELIGIGGTSELSNVTLCAIKHLELNMFGCVDRIRKELEEWS